MSDRLRRAAVRGIGGPVLVALALAAAVRAGAVQQGRVSLRTETLVVARARSPGRTDGWPVYQFLELWGRQPGDPFLSAHLSLWGLALGEGVDFRTQDTLGGDIGLLYLQVQDRHGHYEARLGRQIISSGPGAAGFGQIDGAWIRGAAGVFDVEAYGGREVEARFSNLGRYDWLVGGRAGISRWGRIRSGISFLHARREGRVARERLGVDLSLDLPQKVDVVARAAWDGVDPGLADAVAMARWRGFDRLTLGAQVLYTSPGRAIDRASLFSVFSLAEQLEVGAVAAYAIDPAWVIGAEYGRVAFPSATGVGFETLGDRILVYVSTRPLRGLWLRLAVEREPAPDNVLYSLRLGTRYHSVAGWSVSGEAFAEMYEAPPLAKVGAARRSLHLRAFADRQIGRGLTLGAGLQWGSTVLARSDLQAMVRVTWAAEFTTGGGR
ncbi:MAG: hypothetical protein D6729_18940 [Deltaproteobacteria bacterium]|nr:MAG: hypothetical protein D6729_18940 [Deltaproteobacteria bacterium]